MKPGRIELRIEELVLHGFEPNDRHRIGEAVEHELRRLLTAQDVPSSLTRTGEVPALNGGAFEVSPGSGAEEIGAQVARAVYRGLGA